MYKTCYICSNRATGEHAEQVEHVSDADTYTEDAHTNLKDIQNQEYKV